MLPARRLALVVVALLCGGWMTFDGARALLVGDYVRVDGELGPWAAIPAALGMNPLALAPLFVALGLLWLVGGGLVLRARLAPIRVAAVLTLWYLPVGTILSVAALGLAWRRRG